jgi:hypothetical protein
MLTLSDAIRLPSIVETNRSSEQPGTYKVHYRAWVWLATFAAGTGFWVGLGYSVYAILG